MTATTEQLTSMLQSSLKKTSTMYTLHTTPTMIYHHPSNTLQSHKSIRGGGVNITPDTLSHRMVHEEDMEETMEEHNRVYTESSTDSDELTPIEEGSIIEGDEMDADMVL